MKLCTIYLYHMCIYIYISHILIFFVYSWIMVGSMPFKTHLSQNTSVYSPKCCTDDFPGRLTIYHFKMSSVQAIRFASSLSKHAAETLGSITFHPFCCQRWRFSLGWSTSLSFCQSESSLSGYGTPKKHQKLSIL